MPTPEPKPASQQLREHASTYAKTFVDAFKNSPFTTGDQAQIVATMGTAAALWEIAAQLAELNEFNKAHAVHSSLRAGGGPL